jgi:hypothetical protein
MTEAFLSSEVVKEIRSQCRGDKELESFLMNLLYEESKHSAPSWHGKTFYEDQVKKYSKKK